jgi:hypothetical protein
MLRANKNDVMDAAANGKILEVERLGVHLTINGFRKKFTERRSVYIIRRQNRFRGVRAGTGEVILTFGNINCSRFRKYGKKRRNRN